MRFRFLPLIPLTAALLAEPLFAATFAGVEVPAPPPAQNVTDTHFGMRIDDPYRFLEDVKDPAVQAWMKSQADATTAILAKLPGRDPLLARIKEIESKAAGLTDQAVRAGSGRYFYLKRDPADNQFRLVYRDTANGAERLIVDPEALDEEDRHAARDPGFRAVERRQAHRVRDAKRRRRDRHAARRGRCDRQGARRRRSIASATPPGSHGSTTAAAFSTTRLREGYETLPPAEKFTDHATAFPCARRREYRPQGVQPEPQCRPQAARLRDAATSCRSREPSVPPTSWISASSATRCSILRTSGRRRPARRAGNR